MKVKQLLKILKQCKPDTEVSFEMASGCCGDMEFLEPSRGFEDYYREPDKYFPDGRLSLYFSPLPGYLTCRQAAETLNRHKEYLDKMEKK
jgi:hypothetical protein